MVRPIHALLLTSAVLTSSCGGAKVKVYPGLDRREVATSIVTNVVVPALDAQVSALIALESAISALAAAPNDTTLRDAAKAAFASAMAAVERVEVMQLGPAGSPANYVMGGLDIRPDIYAYELQNACYVDAALVGAQYTTTTALAAQAVNRRGLSAVEYLLYYEGTTSSCTANPTLLSTVTDLPGARSAYALTATTLARQAAERLRDAWSPSGGNFLAQVQTAGQSGSIYRTGQEALNAITDAMFYIELEVKDMKVAAPAGIAICTVDGGVCPGLVESRYAGASVAHIVENVAAFRRLFLGGEPGGTEVGFDDLLASLNQQALTAQILGQLDAVDAAAAAIGAPLEQAVISEKSDVDALYTALQTLATTLKTTFASVIDVNLPHAAGDDTD